MPIIAYMREGQGNQTERRREEDKDFKDSVEKKEKDGGHRKKGLL